MANIHRRGLTSLLTTASFLLATVSGLVAVFRPEGRIAYWTDWYFWGLTKTEWDHLHLVSSLLFVVAAGFHLYFNWPIFWGYFYSKVRKAWHLKREIVAMSVLTLVVAIGSVKQWPPFNLVVLASDSLRASWVSAPEYEPPFGHAEQLSLKIFCKKMRIDLASAVALLKMQGIQVDDPMLTLEQLARRNEASAMQIYQVIKPLEQPEPVVITAWTAESVEETFAGTGVGQKTLAQFCEDQGVDLQTAQARLAGAGYAMAADETFKQAASRQGQHALDFLKLILIESR